MNIKLLAGSGMAVGLLGIGILAGSVVGSGGASAQTSAGSVAPAALVATTSNVASGIQAATLAQAASTPTPGTAQSAPPSTSTGSGNSGSSTITAKITQQQAEQAALAANPGSTVDHTSLQNQNGNPVYDVDFTNGGGALVDGNTGAVISSEAAGQDQGGHGGGPGGADQAALAAQAKVTQQQAEQAALAASPGNTVDHSILQDQNGTIVWDVDFSNGGGVVVNAQTGAVINTEAAGTDQGGGPGGKHGNRPQAPTSAATAQP